MGQGKKTENSVQRVRSGTKDVSVRPMRISDYDQALDLWKASPGIGLRGDDTRSNVLKYLKRNPGFSLVALSRGKIVGTVMGGHDGRRGMIGHLAVAGPFRRRGLGRYLASRCLQKLERAAIPRTHLMVIQSNALGLRFWKKIGWEKRLDIALFSSRFIKPKS
jgi:ribosomal protein S18 acetylase RimI-like enzyme